MQPGSLSTTILHMQRSSTTLSVHFKCICNHLMNALSKTLQSGKFGIKPWIFYLGMQSWANYLTSQSHGFLIYKMVTLSTVNKVVSIYVENKYTAIETQQVLSKWQQFLILPLLFYLSVFPTRLESSRVWREKIVCTPCHPGPTCFLQTGVIQ